MKFETRFGTTLRSTFQVTIGISRTYPLICFSFFRNTTVSDWAWTRVIRTRMFLVRNVRVTMRKLPRFQGQTLYTLVNGHTAIYVLKSLPLETWQFPHSNANVSHEKHTRSNHACPSSIRNCSTPVTNN